MNLWNNQQRRDLCSLERRRHVTWLISGFQYVNLVARSVHGRLRCARHSLTNSCLAAAIELASLRNSPLEHILSYIISVCSVAPYLFEPHIDTIFTLSQSAV